MNAFPDRDKMLTLRKINQNFNRISDRIFNHQIFRILIFPKTSKGQIPHNITQDLIVSQIFKINLRDKITNHQLLVQIQDQLFKIVRTSIKLTKSTSTKTIMIIIPIIIYTNTITQKIPYTIKLIKVIPIIVQSMIKTVLIINLTIVPTIANYLIIHTTKILATHCIKTPNIFNRCHWKTNYPKIFHKSRTSHLQQFRSESKNFRNVHVKSSFTVNSYNII